MVKYKDGEVVVSIEDNRTPSLQVRLTEDTDGLDSDVVNKGTPSDTLKMYIWP